MLLAVLIIFWMLSVLNYNIKNYAYVGSKFKDIISALFII